MKKWQSCERGQAITEFALVLPLLLMLLMGVVEMGRIFYAYLIVNEAARDAVRYVSVGQSDSGVGAVIDEDCQALDSTQITFTITPDVSDRQSGQPVTVEVSYPVVLITPVLNQIFPNPTVVHATMTMRKE